MLQCKDPEQHERDYWEFISNLRRHTFPSKMSHLSREHSREIHRARQRRSVEREFQYDRIERENNLLLQHLDQVRGRLPTKEEYAKDWQRHVQSMKKMCHYPGNVDQFVSNECRKKSPNREKKKKNK